MDFLGKMHVSDLIWRLPDLIWHILDRKVSILDWRSEYFQNMLQFHVEGTHIDVTTLQRNAYFISKMEGLPCTTLRLFAKSQN